MAEYLQRGEALDYTNATDNLIPHDTVVALKDRIGVTGAVEQGVDVKGQTGGNNDLARAHDDGLIEFILLGGQCHDHGLHRLLGDAGPSFQQVLVGCAEERGAIVDVGIVQKNPIALGVDGSPGSGGVSGRDAGHQINVIIDECLAAQSKLFPVGSDLTGGQFGIGGLIDYLPGALRRFRCSLHEQR